MKKLKAFLLMTMIMLGNLFALERVNLIKSHDFEVNASAWTAETGETG